MTACEPASIAVLAAGADRALHERAVALAATLGLPVADSPACACELLLAVTPARLELRSNAARGPGPVYAEFVHGARAYNRRAGPFGQLFRACGSPRTVSSLIDATAGLGQDAFVLAYFGHHVTALERNPLVMALLEDGLARAAQQPDLATVVLERLTSVCVDAREYLRGVTPAQRPDVVYLDPMYPSRTKTALVRKEMRVLRRIVGDDGDAGELLAAARQVARRRVVVKRMRLAPALADDPTRSYAGRAVRYDVYET